MTPWIGVKLKTALIVLLTVAITSIFVLYTKETSQSFSKIERLWANYHENTVAYNEALTLLQSHSGYGGFFDNAQRYLASADPVLLSTIETQQRNLLNAIALYRQTELSSEELDALIQIERSIDEYAQHVKRRSASSTTHESDTIDDQAGVAAMRYLAKTSLIRNQLDQAQASNALSQALSIMLWSNLLIPAAIILGTASIAFMLQTLAGRRRAEANKRNLLSIIEASPDAMITVSNKGLISHCNRQTEKLFHTQRENLINKSLQELIESNISFHGTPAAQLQECVAIVSNAPRVPVEIAVSHAQIDEHNILIITLRDITTRKLIENTLLQNEHRMRSILESVGEGVIGVDKLGICTFVNPAALQLLGYKESSDLVGSAIHERLHHSLADGSQCDIDSCQLHNAVIDGRPYNSDQELVWTASDHNFDAELRSYPLIENDNITGAVITFCDISERKHNETHLKQASIVFNGTKDGIIISDNNGRIIAANQAFTELSGYSETEALGRPIHFHKYEDLNTTPQNTIQQRLKSSGHWQGETWNRRKNNEIYPVWEDISLVTNDQGIVTNYISVFSDISAIKESEQRLNHLAHHDILTGLPNRLLFSVNLTQALERAKRHRFPMGLLFIDLDRFKIINDTLGHAAGDQLLEKIAHRLKKSVRAEDTVARLGGDEFTIILSQMNQPEDAALLAKKIIHTLSRPITVESQDVVISASIGISVYPEDAQSGEDLAKAADAAMYRAKESGRNTYKFYSADMTDKAMEHLALEQGLRQAILKNEFILHYQPQYCLKTNHFAGVEALIRWENPKLGLISPDKFIYIAEETGLISKITEWVLHTACAQIKQWRALGIPSFRVSINISGREVMNPDALANLQSIITQADIAANDLHLELEITEGALHNVSQSLEILNEFKAMGVSLAIDDFGTGYSSLSRLKHLPIDTLKIDRSFVKDLPLNQDDGAIASAVIAMGRSLNLRVIAEGAETKEQIHFLREQGCDEVQGYLLSHPVPAEQIPHIMQLPPPSLALH